jgi:hypothetical protein
MASPELAQLAASTTWFALPRRDLLESVSRLDLTCAINQLSSDERLLWAMFYMEDLSPSEAALVLDLQVPQISHLHASPTRKFAKRSRPNTREILSGTPEAGCHIAPKAARGS